MHRQILVYLLLAIGLLVDSSALAAAGPMQSPLRIIAMYTSNGGGAIYVGFQSGAMPGCYGNSGGYLLSTNTFFKEIYAQLLTLSANGGMQAQVIYTQNTPTNNWDDCIIDGIYLQPQ